jgi:hypothetical protein
MRLLAACLLLCVFAGLPAIAGDSNEDDGIAYGNGALETGQGSVGETDLWVSGHNGHTYGTFEFGEAAGEGGDRHFVRVIAHFWSVFEMFQDTDFKVLYHSDYCTKVMFAGPCTFNGRPAHLMVEIVDHRYDGADEFRIQVFSLFGPLIYKREGELFIGNLVALPRFN